MKKITALLFSIIFLFFPPLVIPSFGEIKYEHHDIEVYLNSIKTLEADLIQISSNGEVETGKLFIKKPGQVRFEYDPPSNHLVIASGLFLVIIDRKSNAEPQRYLSAQTPISYLLNDNIKLHKNHNLKGSFFKNNKLHILFYDQKNASSGELEIIFSSTPLTLSEWTITSYSGEKTRTLLEKLVINEPISKKLFNISHEISKVKKNLK